MTGAKLESVRRVETLWNQVNALGSLADFSDENWCEDYSSADCYFLVVLTWGGWRESRQQQVATEVLRTFTRIAKPIDKLDPTDLGQLTRVYPYRWEKSYLHSMVAYLRRNHTSLTDLVQRMVESGPRLALAEIQLAMGTRATKIGACFLRDCANLDVFPIDRRVKDVLAMYEIPQDSWAIGSACENLHIPTRVFARAVYSRTEALLRKEAPVGM